MSPIDKILALRDRWVAHADAARDAVTGTSVYTSIVMEQVTDLDALLPDLRAALETAEIVKQDGITTETQDRIQAFVAKRAGVEIWEIDGSGCDSGDPVDLTLDEIGQGFLILEERIDELKEQLREADLRAALAQKENHEETSREAYRSEKAAASTMGRPEPDALVQPVQEVDLLRRVVGSAALAPPDEELALATTRSADLSRELRECVFALAGPAPGEAETLTPERINVLFKCVQAAADYLDAWPKLAARAAALAVAPPRCEGCEKGLPTMMLDDDGTLTHLSKRPGVPSHAVEDAWWPCSKWQLVQGGAIPALSGFPTPEQCAAFVETEITRQTRAGWMPSKSLTAWMRSWPQLMRDGELHSWYGPCDGLGNGGCSECERFETRSPDGDGHDSIEPATARSERVLPLPNDAVGHDNRGAGPEPAESHSTEAGGAVAPPLEPQDER